MLAFEKEDDEEAVEQKTLAPMGSTLLHRTTVTHRTRSKTPALRERLDPSWVRVQRCSRFPSLSCRVCGHGLHTAPSAQTLLARSSLTTSSRAHPSAGTSDPPARRRRP